MSQSPGSKPLPEGSLWAWIDRVCDRFERAWRAGERPWFEDYLPTDLSDKEPAAFWQCVSELLFVDLEYRWVEAADREFSSPDQIQIFAHAPTKDLPERPTLADYAAACPLLGPANELPLALVAYEREVRFRYGGRWDLLRELRRTAAESGCRPPTRLLFEQFAIRWRDGNEPPDVFAFIAEHPGISRRDQADVVLVDQFYRWQAGIGLPAERYFERCLDLARDPELELEIVTEEFRCRQLAGEDVDRSEFARRYPHVPLGQARASVPSRSRRDRSGCTTTRPAPGDRAAGADTPVMPPAGPRSRESDVSVGECVGRYRLERVLGRGGFGTVYVAYDGELERRVAVKIPRRQFISSKEQLECFLREARVLASLDHPRIVPVYDVGQTEEGGCYVVSKLVDGCNLASRISAARLEYPEAAKLVAEVAAALHYAHKRGLVHRDVKPANILIDRSGEPYVADFGLALREADFGRGESWAGTPAYMSPEQARGEGHLVDGRSDVFSLGVVLYELLTGSRPFPGDSVGEILERIRTQEPRPPRQTDDTIAKELERICLKALSKRASDRYTTALDLADDLKLWLAELERAPQTSLNLPLERSRSADVLAPLATTAPPGSTSSKGTHQVAVVPKGLRSFDQHDADFFLRLLPGPYDRDGLPESVRFWKTTLQETDPDRAFRVGMLYGPSGCGKSSLVKAGLLPRMGEQVITVYVEATPEDTEACLLRKITRRFPELEGSGLPEIFKRLRRDACLLREKKLVVVLDQFEQWLHTRRDYADTELVRALRQCDGGRVQALVLIRDDFWMAATRFMHDIEVPLAERVNSAAVDLFDINHARRVLIEFGVAYGRLSSRHELSREQSRFVDEAVASLAENGEVIPVRLSLFAEMMKAKDWVSSTLKGLGGEQGVRLRFLEDSLDGSHCPPEHRLHQKALRAVLHRLLPEKGTDLKVAMRSRQDLLEISGYAKREADFSEVLRILADLRLITPIDPEGTSFTDAAPPSSGTTDKFYQLAHDYLVPSLREWLSHKQRETRRGRARLLLDERCQQWNVMRQNRLLPSLYETALIMALTRRSDRTPLQREMLRRARWVHVRQLVAAAAVVLVMTFATYHFFPQPPSNSELADAFANHRLSTTERLRALDRLDINDVGVLPRVVNELQPQQPPELVVATLARLAELTPQASSSRPLDRSDPFLRLLASALPPMLEHPAGDVELQAFELYSRIASTDEVLALIAQNGDRLQPGAVAEMADWIAEIPLTDIDPKARARSLVYMARIISTSQSAPLVAACVSSLDELEPQTLFTLLTEAYGYEIEMVVAEGLRPYLARAESDRVRRLGRWVEGRLKELVPASIEEIADGFEVQLAAESLAAIKDCSQTNESYTAGLGVLDRLLRRPDLLSDVESLAPIVRSFAVLNRERRVPPDPLRRLLADTAGECSTRVAAARAVGDLGDLASLPLLSSLAAEPQAPFNLRAEAVESLGKLARNLPPDPASRQRLREQLRQIFLTIIADPGNQPEVLVPAISGIGESGEPEDAALLVPLLQYSPTNFTASQAILSMLIARPGSADIIVRKFVQWRATVDVAGLPEDLDMAVIGFHLVKAPDQDELTAAKSIARSLATAAARVEPLDARQCAAALLARFVSVPEMPRIDPGAAVAIRQQQWEEWQAWWSGWEIQSQLIGCELRPHVRGL